MPVNFNLLARQGPSNFAEGLVQGQEAAMQNALVQQKMAQDQETNALNRQKAQIDMQSALLGQETARLGQETTRLGQERTRSLMTAETEERARARRVERAGMFRERLLRAGTPEAAREIVRMQYADPDLAPVLSQAGTLEQALAEVPEDLAQFQTYRQQEAMGMGEWMKSQLPKVVGNAVYLPDQGRFATAPVQPKETPKPADIILLESLGLAPTLENINKLKQAQTVTSQESKDPLIRQYEYAQNQGFKGSLFDYKRSIAEAGRPLAAAGGGGNGRAKAEPTAKPLTEVQQLKLQKDAANDISSVKNSQTTANELEMLADQLVGSPEKKIPPHPGLSRITGLMSKIPNAPESNAAKAQQKLETFKGKIKTFGRQLASQEGKLGNMAVQEWKFIADSVESIDPYAGNLNEQMRDAVRQAKSFADRMQEKYDLTYEGVNVSPRGAAKSAGAGAAESTPAVIKSLVDKYTKGK
jgi:hypothetical protein